MAKVKQRNTEPEIIVRQYLFSKGFRYRINVKTLPGSPDIVLPKYKIVIFVHGCFWHGHSCHAGHLPSSNIDYWKAKIEANRERDNRKVNDLKTLGWKVITIWQCEIKTSKKTMFYFCPRFVHEYPVFSCLLPSSSVYREKQKSLLIY